MPSNKKKFTLNTVSVDLGCSSCKRPRLSYIFHPKPKPPTSQKHTPFYYPTNFLYSSSFSNTSYTSSSSSSKTTTNPFTNTNTSPQFSGSSLSGFGRVEGESVAVEKESNDPYLDFRHSMIQMILEKEIYS